MNDTLSQISAAQRVTDWVHNSSVENNNNSQTNVADADPSACASVHPTAMSPSFPVNREVVNISNDIISTTKPTAQQPCFNKSRVRLVLAPAYRQ